MLNAPLRFTPYLRPMVWGGRALGDRLGKRLETLEPYGESWEVSDHPSHETCVASGPVAGCTLRQLMEEHRSELLGPNAASQKRFPWLVKFLDARDWLSVQVHPDNEAVKRLWPGEGGKTEGWFIVDAAPGSLVYAGLLPGVDEKRLRQALDDGTVAACLHRFTPKPGDCLFLPAGTVHAVGGGVLMAEVQQTSDATFRLFDWNRRDSQGKTRQLHVEQSLTCIDWQRGPVTPVQVAGFDKEGGLRGLYEYRRQPLVRCAYFNLDYLQSSEPFPLGGTGRMEVLLTVQGTGRIESEAGIEDLAVGQVLVLPAAMPRVWCNPTTSLGLVISSLP